MERIVVIAGSSSGIGKACAEWFETQGDTVWGFDRRNLPNAPWTTVVGDVSSRIHLTDFRTQLDTAHGHVDSLVYSVAMSNETDLWDMTDSEWQDVLNINLVGMFRFAHALVPLLKRSTTPSIVNVGSVAGQRSGKFSSASYAASKAGVIALSRSMARNLADHGIRVNCVNPGFTDTPLIGHWNADRRAAAGREVPLGRIGKPEEVARVIAFLASPEASYVTGTQVDVNGGLHMI